VVRREPADGIGGRNVAGETERLAAAAAPVLLLAPERAGAARLLHPVRAAEARERLRLVPDPLERAVAHVGELEAGIVAAAWHGSASPLGATMIAVRTQPPMHCVRQVLVVGSPALAAYLGTDPDSDRLCPTRRASEELAAARKDGDQQELQDLGVPGASTRFSRARLVRPSRSRVQLSAGGRTNDPPSSGLTLRK
jgi:hypothetical protein